MIPRISPRFHGLLDFGSAAVMAASARGLDLIEPARRTVDVWAVAYAALSALTDSPAGVRRVVPFRVHGTVDRALTLALPVLPWLVGFSRDRRARSLFLGLAAVTAVVTMLTDWSDDAG
jgi:hypothetical protein